MEYKTLNNGLKMPILGYGVYQVTPEECEKCVYDAIAAGYRLIDTAQAYANEEGVAKAIAKSGIKREEFFITTKIWISNAGYEKAKASIDESLKKLNTSYVDLMLIHQPFGDYYGTYRAMEEAYKEGKIKAIGVSNFYSDRLIDLIKFNEVVPAVNQVETHPYNQQKEAHKIMEKYNVQHESWGPFAEGRKDMFTNLVIKKIADKHNKSIAQVILRFLIQNDVVVIPKSIHKNRMEENINVFDFTLSDEEMKTIATLDENESAFFSHSDPSTVEFLTGLGR